MELLHPRTAADVVEIVRGSGADGTRLLPVGGRRHIDKGNPCEIDAELWTTQLDEVIAYDPAEMLAVVGAGLRIGDLRMLLAEGAQEWPVDAPADATVGGVIAAGLASPRHLRVGAMRDSVVQLTSVLGDGRLVTSGARTVKNVSGYDVHRLMTGSLGTLGVVVSAALKVRPLPRARMTLIARGDGPAIATIVRAAVPMAPVAYTPDEVRVRLEGWPAEVDELAALVAAANDTPFEQVDASRFPGWHTGAPIVAEVSLPPSAMDEALMGHDHRCVLAGVGSAKVGLNDLDALVGLRDRVTSFGGIAPVIHGPGGLGDADMPALEVHRRLKDAFDPHGVMAPGRYWSGL
ncbi:MAG TPA: FAD-binding protein [Actinomycetota bacterium]